MATGGGSPRDSEQQGPGFTWLYGGQQPPSEPMSDPVSDSGSEDQRTRMLPVQPRGGYAAPGAGGSAYGPGPSASGPATAPRPVVPRPTPGSPGAGYPPVPPPPGGRTYRGGGGGVGGFLRRRATRPRFWIRTVLILVLVWVLYTVLMPVITLKSMHEVDWEPSGQRPADQPGTTYLLVGSDSRAGLTAAQRRQYHTGDHQENLADTIMILHTGSGPNVLLSIPRDSEVDMPGYGESKINSAYGRGGAKLLTKTVEQNTGVRIDKYVEIGLGGVASVVDAVGGIRICPTYRMDDKDAGLHVKKGCQQADGQVALAYARSRHAQKLGDLDRVKHQREVVAAIGHKVISPWSVLNPIRWWKLNHAVPDFFHFGSGMGTLAIMQWASAMSHTTGSGGLTCTMPVTSTSANQWDMTRAKPLLNDIITDQTDKITKQECTPAGIVGAS